MSTDHKPHETITVALCRPKDCPDIAALGRKVWGEWATGETLPRQLIDIGHPVFVARDPENRLVGYVVGAVDASGSSALVMSMTIHEDFRHQGVGTELLDAMLTHLDRKPIARILTNIDPENKPSLGLFKKRGFVVTDEMPGYYQHSTMLRLERDHP